MDVECAIFGRMEQSQPRLTWDSYMEILRGNLTWDSYMGILSGTLTWESYVGIGYHWSTISPMIYLYIYMNGVYGLTSADTTFIKDRSHYLGVTSLLVSAVCQILYPCIPYINKTTLLYITFMNK